MLFHRVSLVALLGALVACERAAERAPEADAPRSEAVSTAADTTPVTPDPALVPPGPKLPEEFEDVFVECDTNSRSMWNECKAYRALRESRWVKDASTGKDLVPMLSDPRVMVRLLAVIALSDQCRFTSCGVAKDRALSEAILTQAETETDDRVRSNFPSIIARIDVGATDLGERVEALVQKRAESMALGILRDWLEHNPSVYPRLAELATSPQPDIKKAALAGLGRALAGEHHAEACNILVGALATADVPVDVISYRVVKGDHGSRCVGSWDKYISTAETRLERLDRVDTGVLRSLFDLYEESEATTAQKARILALSRKVAESSKKDRGMRMSALTFIARHDPQPLPYVRRFKKDREAKLASWAQKLETEITQSATLSEPTEPRRTPARLR
jgi:hypothetical protein